MISRNRYLPHLALLAAFLMFIAASYFCQSRIFATFVSEKLTWGLPALVGVILLAVAMFRPKLMPQMALATVMTGVMLCLVVVTCERFLQDVTAHWFRMARAWAVGVGYDQRSRLEVIQDHRNAGVRAYPLTIPCCLVERGPVKVGARDVVPLSGIANVHTVLDNEVGRWVEYVSDEQGFNNPLGLWKGFPADVVLIGDSFLNGAGVRTEESVGGVVRQLGFQKTLSLGIFGNGPLAELGSLIEYGGALRPRVVVWYYYEGNDLDDLGWESRSLLSRYLDDPDFRQNLLGLGDELNRELVRIAEDAIATKKSPCILANELLFRRGLTWAAQGPLTPPPRERFDTFRRVIERARETVSTWDGQLWFVLLPTWYSYTHPGPTLKGDRAQILKIARDAKLPTIDAVDLFAQLRDPLDCFPYHLNGHYTAQCYRLLGEDLARRLKAAGISAGTASEEP